MGMRQFEPLDPIFRGRHFEREIIILCVRWYLSFKRSFRDLAAMIAERGISVARSTREHETWRTQPISPSVSFPHAPSIAQVCDHDRS